MTFFPENLTELFVFVASLVTLTIGLAFFFVPKMMFVHLKLQGVEKHPEAFGESRSTFAGFLLAGATLVFVTKDPKILFLLALAWALASFGKILHIVVDGGRSKTVLLRFVMALVLAVLFYWGSEIPALKFQYPSSIGTMFAAISGLVTLIFGVMCMFLPQISLSIMRLRSKEEFESAKGEVRGNVAGYYLAAAIGLFFISGQAALLFLGIGWLMTAFGRVISMLSDGTNNLFNWISLFVEFSLAMLPLLLAFAFVV